MSHLLKNLVERADKDEDGEVTIEEILTFGDFEFIESSFKVVPYLVRPGTSMFYLVECRRGRGRGCGREEREAVVAMWFNALQVPIASARKFLGPLMNLFFNFRD